MIFLGIFNRDMLFWCKMLRPRMEMSFGAYEQKGRAPVALFLDSSLLILLSSPNSSHVFSCIPVILQYQKCVATHEK